MYHVWLETKVGTELLKAQADESSIRRASQRTQGVRSGLSSWRKVTTMVVFLWHFRKLDAVKMSGVYARQDLKQMFYLFTFFPLVCTEQFSTHLLWAEF